MMYQVGILSKFKKTAQHLRCIRFISRAYPYPVLDIAPCLCEELKSSEVPIFLKGRVLVEFNDMAIIGPRKKGKALEKVDLEEPLKCSYALSQAGSPIAKDLDKVTGRLFLLVHPQCVKHKAGEKHLVLDVTINLFKGDVPLFIIIKFAKQKALESHSWKRKSTFKYKLTLDSPNRGPSECCMRG